MISAGTTGLSTWPAALELAELLLDQPGTLVLHTTLDVAHGLIKSLSPEKSSWSLAPVLGLRVSLVSRPAQSEPS